jgi:tRNA (cmo5U34)-methyltransferase
LYGLVKVLLAENLTPRDHVLIAGAGGGREIEALAVVGVLPSVTALDPSATNLEGARLVAKKLGMFDAVEFFEGTVGQLADVAQFDVVTSLLVMNNIQGRAAKLDYLMSIRKRLRPNGFLVIADICVDIDTDFEILKSLYRAQAAQIGTSEDLIRIELEAVTRSEMITPGEFRSLCREARWGVPSEVFRTLWYRCWLVEPDNH